MTQFWAITGADNVIKNLQRLEDYTKNKMIVATAKQTNQEVFQPAVESNAKTMVGGDMGTLLANSVKVVTRKKRRGVVGASVVIDSDNDFVHISKKGIRYYIPFAIEYGHATPFGSELYKNKISNEPKKRRRNRAEIDAGLAKKDASKEVKPIPFMRRAFESRKGWVLNYFNSILSQKIKDYMAKQNSASAAVEKVVDELS